MITTLDNDRKERLSMAYLTAVAAHSGCQIVSWALDKMTVDASVRAISGSRAIVDIQMKATSTDPIQGNDVVFDLLEKNFDDLRAMPQMHPHYMVVLYLPGTLSSWMTLTSTELAIHGCAYWFNLAGLPAIHPPAKQQRVKASKQQHFTVSVLENMILSAPNRVGGPGQTP